MSKRTSSSRIRKNKGPWQASVQAKRREVAEARNMVYTKLSTEQKLMKLDLLKHTATKQRAKLMAKLDEETK